MKETNLSRASEPATPPPHPLGGPSRGSGGPGVGRVLWGPPAEGGGTWAFSKTIGNKPMHEMTSGPWETHAAALMAPGGSLRFSLR